MKKRNRKKRDLFLAITIGTVLLFINSQTVQARVKDDVFENIVTEEIGKDNKITELNKDIEEKAQAVRNLEEKRNIYQKNIDDARDEKLSLENEIIILENNIDDTETAIKQKEIEQEILQLEIETLKEQISIAETEINRQKEILRNLIVAIYNYDQTTPLEIFFRDNETTLSDFLSEAEYTEKLQNDMQASLDTVQVSKKAMRKKRIDVKDKKAEVNQQEQKLKEDKIELLEKQTYKEDLIVEVEESEEKFQELYDNVRREHDQTEGEIAALEGSVQEKINNIREKVLEQLNDDDETNDEVISNDELDFLNNGGSKNFTWPIESRLITCGFKCPDYPFRSIFEHSGIDVATPQGTDVKAAASGYVTVAKFDGTSALSIIRIDNGNGLASIYMHVSCVKVAVDQYVERGDSIACSGGLRGAPGSGAWSTGAHLHFEVRADGIPVDPLLYLP